MIDDTHENPAGWPGLERLREDPVDVRAALLLNHRELLGFIHGIDCEDVAERRRA